MTATTSSTLDQLQRTVDAVAAQINAIDGATDIIGEFLFPDGSMRTDLDRDALMRFAEDALAMNSVIWQNEAVRAIDLLEEIGLDTINVLNGNVVDAWLDGTLSLTFTGRYSPILTGWDVTGATITVALGGPNVIVTWDGTSRFAIEGTWGGDTARAFATSDLLHDSLEYWANDL